MESASSDDFGGSCACGAVTYVFETQPRSTIACHCSICRKTTGSAFGTWALVPKESFRIATGQEHLAEFESSSHGRRLFCRRCGSTLAALTSRRPKFMHVAAGTLDRAPPTSIALHAYTASKAPWFAISDGLPQHDEEPAKRG